eukprot:SAG31_NODE_1481_length_8176_cov_3.282531_3_plen_261_part_00
MADGPIAGNGLLGVVTAPHRESWPSSPANDTALGRQVRCGIDVVPHVQLSTQQHGQRTPCADISRRARQTLWIGSNSFWSANTYGADEAGAPWVKPSSGPFPHCEVPYGMLGVGGLTVDFTAGPTADERGVRYSATQELCSAQISSTVERSRAQESFQLRTIVLSDDNAILTNISCSGCTMESTVTVDLWMHKGFADKVCDQRQSLFHLISVSTQHFEQIRVDVACSHLTKPRAEATTCLVEVPTSCQQLHTSRNLVLPS